MPFYDCFTHMMTAQGRLNEASLTSVSHRQLSLWLLLQQAEQLQQHAVQPGDAVVVANKNGG